MAQLGDVPRCFLKLTMQPEQRTDLDLASAPVNPSERIDAIDALRDRSACAAAELPWSHQIWSHQRFLKTVQAVVRIF